MSHWNVKRPFTGNKARKITINYPSKFAFNLQVLRHLKYVKEVIIIFEMLYRYRFGVDPLTSLAATFDEPQKC